MQTSNYSVGHALCMLSVHIRTSLRSCFSWLLLSSFQLKKTANVQPDSFCTVVRRRGNLTGRRDTSAAKGDAFLMKLSQDWLTLLILGYTIINRIKVILSFMAKNKSESVSPHRSSIQASFQHLFSKLKKLEWLELVMSAGTVEASQLKFHTTLVRSL